MEELEHIVNTEFTKHEKTRIQLTNKITRNVTEVNISISISISIYIYIYISVCVMCMFVCGFFSVLSFKL